MAWTPVSAHAVRFVHPVKKAGTPFPPGGADPVAGVASGHRCGAESPREPGITPRVGRVGPAACGVL